MPLSSTSPTDQRSAPELDLEDFHRLGVRPFECRQTVIRLAAVRKSRILATEQLVAPSTGGSLRLSRVATSAYRLLDPRLRRDPLQRALVGRILPHTLTAAGQTNFSNEFDRRRPQIPSVDPQAVEDLDWQSWAGEVSSIPEWRIKLADADLVHRRHKRIAGHRWRSATRRRVGVALVAAGIVIGGISGVVTTTGKLETTQRMLHETLTGPRKIDQWDNAPVADRPAVAAAVDSGGDPANQDESAARFDPGKASPRSRSPAPTSLPVPSATGAAMPIGVTEEIRDQETSLRPAGPPVEPKSLPASPAVAPSLSAGDRSEQSEVRADQLPADQIPADSGTTAQVSADQVPSDHVPADQVYAGFPVPGADDLRAARRSMMTQIPIFSQSLDVDSIDQRIAHARDFAEQSQVGTPAHFAAILGIVDHHWLTDDWTVVKETMRQLGGPYDIDLPTELAASFIRVAQMAQLPSTLDRLCVSGLSLLDWLLLCQSLDCGSSVVTALDEMVLRVDRPQLPARLQDFARAIEQMQRLSNASHRWVSGDQTQISGDTGVAGRYHCLMLRNWKEGLPWLAQVSDKRLARVAQQDLEASDPESWLAVAQRWNTLATRTGGRAGDSMRLRAVDLFRLAGSRAGVLQRLEIEHAIDQVIEALPIELQQLARSPAPQMESTQDDPPPEVESTLPRSDRIDGQITFAGSDAHIKLNYQLGAAISPATLEQIRQHIDLPDGSPTINLQGWVDLDQPTVIDVSVNLDQHTEQTFEFDGQPVDLDPFGQGARLHAEPGSHRIRWSIIGKLESSVWLNMHDASSGNGIAVGFDHDNGSRPEPALTVDVVRAPE